MNVSPMARALLKSYQQCKVDHGAVVARQLTREAVAVIATRFRRTPRQDTPTRSR